MDYIERGNVQLNIIQTCMEYGQYNIAEMVDLSIFDIQYRLLFMHLFYEDQPIYVRDYNAEELKNLESWENILYYEDVSDTRLEEVREYINLCINKLLS